MSVKLEWKILDQDDKWHGGLPPPPPSRPPMPWRKYLLVLLALIVAGVVLVAGYLAWAYRARLNEVSGPVQQVAKLEAQAVAANDLAVFMALQDPQNADWQDAQAARFGRFEQIGLPEYGWKAMGAQPQLGQVTLEPGGAGIQATYRFSLTHPLPGGPAVVTVHVPQFYRQEASGWARAMPGSEYWGAYRTTQGAFVKVAYFQRDASLAEPLVSQADEIIASVCSAFPCPRRATIVFGTSPEAMSGVILGNAQGDLALAIPSPHLWGIPADDGSRQEFYRAIKLWLVKGLIGQIVGERAMRYASFDQVVRWEQARLNLVAPFISSELTRALAAELESGAWRPLDLISLGWQANQSTLQQVVLPLSLAFVEEQFGPGSLARLTPRIASEPSVGSAISATFGIDPTTLDAAWWMYLHQQAGEPVAFAMPDDGELTLVCSPANAGPSIWRMHSDGAESGEMVENAFSPAWSPDGKSLAYISSFSNIAMVADENGQAIDGMPLLMGTELGWLPDGRLWVAGAYVEIGSDTVSRYQMYGAYLMDFDTGQLIELFGSNHTWSANGKQVAYLSMPNQALWVADADGGNARQIASGWRSLPTGGAASGMTRVAPGYDVAWSPDVDRLAFVSSPLDSVDVKTLLLNNEIRIADVEDDSDRMLTRSTYELLLSLEGDLADFGRLYNMEWSPDGSALAVAMYWPGGASVAVLDALTLEPTSQVSGYWSGAFLQPGQSWSPDGRYLVFKTATEPTLVPVKQGVVVVWDTQTGEYVTLPGNRWAWSPEGEWLAVLQYRGVLIVKPDMSAGRWLSTLDCSDVMWRPAH